MVFAELRGSSQDRETLEALAFGFFANRQMFSEFVCEFTVTDGEVDSVADARALRVNEKFIKEGIWVVSQ